jgi:hypothetical protein
MSGDPGGYPEGVDPTQSVTSQIGRGLQPLAHPQSATDIGRLLMAPTDATRSMMAYAPAAMQQAGNMARMAGRVISRTHVHPVDAALNFEVTKPFKALGRLVTVDPVQKPPTLNPLANMGQGPSIPAAAVSGPTTMQPPVNRPPLERISGMVSRANPNDIPQKTLNELAIHARRAGVKGLTEEEYQALATLVSEGSSPADAIAALARIR